MGGEVKEAKTIDAGGQELLSPPSFFIHLSQSKYVRRAWKHVGAGTVPWMEENTQRHLWVNRLCILCITYTVVRVVVHYNES